MKSINLLPGLLYTQLSLILGGAILKILHLPFAELLLGCGIIVCLIFTILSLKEIYSSSKLTSLKKSKWLFAFLFVNTIAGFYYISYSRKGILDKDDKQ